MTRIQVSDTQFYSKDFCGIEAQLILIPNKKPPADVYINNRGFHPILISLTEEIETDDWLYDSATQEIFKVENDYHLQAVNSVGFCNKILALPEHFSEEQLHQMANKNLRNSETVIIECQINETNKLDSIYFDINNKINLIKKR